MDKLIIRHLGEQDYTESFAAMQAFTAQRNTETSDEIWLLQHPPVFTQGLAGKAEHLLHATDIPVNKIDRGGQITYHGPGQLVAYVLLDLRRNGLGVRQLVRALEQSVIDLLAEYTIEAAGSETAPGVYVGAKKIAALGLRITRGCCYHGLSLNVSMDLSPFQAINPCGYAGLEITQMQDFGVLEPISQIEVLLAEHLQNQLAPFAMADYTHRLPDCWKKYSSYKK